MTRCPTEQELIEFLAGELSERADAILARHFEGCPHCQSVAERQVALLEIPPPGRMFGNSAAGAFSSSADSAGFVNRLARISPAGFRLADDETDLPAEPALEKNGAAELPASIDKYRILSLLGLGGMATVYLATDPDLKREVAIKVLSGDRRGDQRAIRRARLEMQALGRLSHPNIVAVTNAGMTSSGLPFLVMERLHGADLDSVVRERGPLPVTEAASAIIDAARGLHFAHRQGMIHRDVKPGNLFQTQDGPIKVLDFGLAALEQTEVFGSLRRLTRTGVLMGTPEFMAPEQATDPQTVDERADIYSLGCTFAWLLTGKRVFQRESRLLTIEAHRRGEIPRLDSFGVAVPRGLQPVFEKMVATDPANRFESMQAVAEALSPFTNLARDGLERRRRRQRIATGIAGLLLAAIVVIVTKPEVNPSSIDPATPTSRETTGVDTTESPVGISGRPERLPQPNVSEVRQSPATATVAAIARWPAETVRRSGILLDSLPPVCVIESLANQPSLTSKAGAIGAVEFLDQSTVAVATRRGDVQIWSIDQAGSAGLLNQIPVSERDLTSLVRLPEPGMFAVSGDDSIVRIFRDFRLPPVAMNVSDYLGGAVSLACCLQNGRLYSGHWGQRSGFVLEWDLRGREFLARHDVATEVARCVDVSHSGDLIATAGNAGVIRVWKSDWSQVLHEFAPRSAVYSLTLSPDERQLVSVGESGIAHAWSLSDRSLLWTCRLMRGSGPVSCCRYSSDGRFVIFGGRPGLSVLDAASGAVVRQIYSEVPIESFALSPDQSLLAATCGWLSSVGNGHIYFWTTDSLTGAVTAGLPQL